MLSIFSRRSWNWIRRGVSLLVLVSLLPGCAGTERSLTYFGEARELDYYEDVATRIEYPNTETETNPQATSGAPPRDLTQQKHDQIWNMTLAEAIHLSLANNKIIRTRNDFLGGSSLYSSPDNVASVYDAAIRDSGVLFGGRGVESALSQFDTQWTTNMIWGGSQSVSNNAFAANGVGAGSILTQDTAVFSSGLTKNFAYGAQGSVTQNWNYSANDSPSRLFRSAYDGNLAFNYTQPLWAGAGAEFTRIAGPASSNISGLSGVNQGVLIARINTDISLVDFEISVRNMLRDVEDTYWDLYLAYRRYDSIIVARNSNLRTWRDEHARLTAGTGAPADEAQAREAYFNARAEAENALGGGADAGVPGIYALELQLRRLCGLPSNDGRVIRPSDEPVTAELLPDWHASLAEGLTRREELRRQKWNIKSLELQLIAAENIANPRFDFVSSYQLNGFGNDLIANNTASSGPGAFESAYGSQFSGKQAGYTVGFQFSMPFGLRNVKAQVRNSELRLAKAREVLAVQEQEISHELTNAFQNLKWRHQTSQTNFNRRRAAERQVQTVQEEYKIGTKTLDLLLRAQTALATAEIAYYASVVGYNKAIADLHYRKGTLLENDGVQLAEGAWTPDAMKDALRRAWARTYAFDPPSFDPVHTEPDPVEADGPYPAAMEMNGPAATDPATGGAYPLPTPLPPSNESAPFEVPPSPQEATPEGPQLQPATYQTSTPRRSRVRPAAAVLPAPRQNAGKSPREPARLPATAQTVEQLPRQ